MSVRELVVLGTASQVPTRRRNHNGYFLRWDGDGLLFDPGEGTQRQMIHFGVTATSISDVLITHFHGDHCLGLASLVQRISLDEVPHAVRVHYPASGQVYFDRLRKASIFRDVARLEPLPISAPGTLLETSAWRLEARALDHGPECYGYRLAEPDSWNVDPALCEARGLRGPVLRELKANGCATAPDGSVVQLADVGRVKRGQRFAFVMDTRVCPSCVELARDVDMLVIESTYLHEHVDEAVKNGHLTARQAAEIAREAGVRKLVLTHLSQRYRDTEPFLAEAAAIHPDCVVVEDGDVVPLPPPLRGGEP
ncbi:MAG: ribonuclease Z [Planctomycetes bacterium]|nr:ribonuclease Z [Planctomycetota bacterium]